MRHTYLLWCVVPLVSGCYLFHGREDSRGADAGSSGPRADAGTTAGRDAGRSIFVDGDVLPDDEPDVMPGERPSDDPSAPEWTDPPPAGSGPCCDVGEVVGLDDPMRQTSAPRVAWDGSEWGVAWSDMSWPTFAGDPLRALFRRLDAGGRPSTDPLVIDGIYTGLEAMAYGNHRFALLTSESAGFRATQLASLAIVDRDGGLRARAYLPDGYGGVAIARDEAIHGWAVVATVPDDNGDSVSQNALLVYDESLAEVARAEVGWAREGDGHAAIVSLKSLLVVASGIGSTTIRVFAPRSLEPVGATDVGALGDQLGGARMRDTVALAGRWYGDSPLRTLVWDPFDERVVAGPTEVAHATGGGGIALAADEVGGTMGLCYPVGGSEARDADGLMFVLLGPDGTPLGEPVLVASGFRYVASCAVGAAGPDTYAVLWWASGGEPPAHHSILAARVTVRR